MKARDFVIVLIGLFILIGYVGINEAYHKGYDDGRHDQWVHYDKLCQVLRPTDGVYWWNDGADKEELCEKLCK